jgi:fructose/tagatose bisphosphate aldolase
MMAETRVSGPDQELYTDPDEAQWFVKQTGINALAVSAGTALRVYNVRQTIIGLERLSAIRRHTDIPL